MNVLDLFSGIGGFSLGLERAGMRTVAFCEREPYARAVLAKHWPSVPCYDDVCTLTADRLRTDGIAIDVICGGFPCQDISLAGNGAGLAGERSGLWREYARLIGELRPRFVIVENVAALLSRGLAEVLGDLAALGFDAEWHCIPASAVGAPHRRDRIWIVAYPGGEQHESNRAEIRRQIAAQLSEADYMAHAAGERCGEAREFRRDEPAQRTSSSGETLADADREGLQNVGQARQPTSSAETKRRVALTEFERCGGAWWAIEPDVGRVAHGVPSRVDRLRCLGNAVVPQIPEIIGRAIIQSIGD